MRRFRRLLPGLANAAALILLAWPAAASGDPEPPRLRLPAVAEPAGYSAELAIDPARDGFRGSIDIEIRLKQKTGHLWINGTDLRIDTASASSGGRSIGVRSVPGGEDFVGFVFRRPVGPGKMTLHVEYAGRLGETTTQGLFRQKDGEDWYAFSQFESTDARRAFPCFDEPSYKVPWRLTLRIPNGTTAVSNTPIESEAAAADGSRVVHFKKTEPLPSYLVALGVGPFDYLEAGSAGAKKTPVRIVTPRGKASQGRYAAQTTGPLLERLEAYFGIPYPYEKLDQLAIPQTVTFGAMENAGLITWSERALLAPPAEETVAFQRLQASWNAHEMAHQWFGDLVTLAWWDDAWLNESFATWMSDRTLIEWKPEWGGEVDRVVSRSKVMYDDTLVTARKIRQEIASADDIVNAFDDITYHKGASVLAMFEAWVGPEKFRAGVHRYLDAHRLGNATARDFLGALESASQPGVAAAFFTFLDQPGVPLLGVSLECSGGDGRLHLTQKRLLPAGSTGRAAETWRIPVCARSGTGAGEARGCALLTQPAGSMQVPSGGCPAWLLANDGELGYYRALYEGELLSKLLAVADERLTVAERVGLIRDVNAEAEAGAVPMSEALALASRFSGASSRQIVLAAVRIAAGIRDHLVPADLEPGYARFVSRAFGTRARGLGFSPKPGEDDDTRLLREELVPFVAREGVEPQLQTEAQRLALAWLEDHASVGAEMAGRVLEVAAQHGDRALFERFLSAAKAAKERRDRIRLLDALGSFEDPTLRREALALFLSGDFDPREAEGVLFTAARSPQGHEPVWEFVKANYDAIVGKLPREATGIMPLFASGFCDAGRRKDAEAFFQNRIEKLPGGPRYLAQSLEEIDLCIASKAAQEPSVREFLENY